MDQICQNCRSLLSSGTRASHHLSISQLSNSELLKCSTCKAYVLLEPGNIEIMQVCSPAPLQGSSQNEQFPKDQLRFAFR